MGRKGGKKPDQPEQQRPTGQQQPRGGARESALDFAGNAALLEHLQGRLGSLVGKSSGYLETLPQQVQTRIKGLKHLHGKHVELEKQFNAEVAELEKKYMALYKPLYERRSAIVSGAAEPTEEELAAKEEEKKDEEKKEAAPTTDAKGVPEFWLTALKHHPDFGSMISERDEEALKSLTEIKVSAVENEPHSFSVEFHFADNEFFEDKIVKKTYVLKEQPEDSEVVYDHVDATEIKWKPGKDLTRKKVTKTQKAKGGRRGGRGGAAAKPQTITVEQPCESFFNFFNPEAAFEIAMGEYQEEDDDELAEQGFQEFLEMDYELGLEFKDKLVPHAVVWFTGEAAIGLMGEDDFEDDEEFDEDDDDEEIEEDYTPAAKTDGNQQQPECKQQ